MTIDEIRELLVLAKEQGVQCLSYQDLNFSFQEAPGVLTISAKETPVTPQELSPAFDPALLTQRVGVDKGAPSDEEMLFWSADTAIAPIRTSEPQE